MSGVRRSSMKVLCLAFAVVARLTPAPLGVEVSTVVMEEAQWTKLETSHDIDDFKFLHTRYLPVVEGIARGVVAQLKHDKLLVAVHVPTYDLSESCGAYIKLTNGTVWGGLVSLTPLEKVIPDPAKGTLNAELTVDVSMLLNAWTIIKRGVVFPFSRDCWYIGERTQTFGSDMIEKVALKLQVHPLKGRAEERNGTRNVILQFNASLDRKPPRSDPVFQAGSDIKAQHASPHGCVLHFGFFTMAICRIIESTFLRPHKPWLLERIPNLTFPKVLQALEGRINEVVGSVAIPVAVTGRPPA